MYSAPLCLFWFSCFWSVNSCTNRLVLLLVSNIVSGKVKTAFVFLGLSKAETQALTNYGSGEDENEEEEMEEFEAGPVDVQTSLQASADGQVEQEVGGTQNSRLLNVLTLFWFWKCSCFRSQQATIAGRRQLNSVQRMKVGCFSFTMSDGLVPQTHLSSVFFFVSPRNQWVSGNYGVHSSGVCHGEVSESRGGGWNRAGSPLRRSLCSLWGPGGHPHQQPQHQLTSHDQRRGRTPSNHDQICPNHPPCWVMAPLLLSRRSAQAAMVRGLMKRTSWRWTTCRCSSQSCVRCVYHGVNRKLMWPWCWWAVLCQKEELQKRIVEEQQNNNLSMEILNGNAESVTGLVGNAQALKEPGTDHCWF